MPPKRKFRNVRRKKRKFTGNKYTKKRNSEEMEGTDDQESVKESEESDITDIEDEKIPKNITRNSDRTKSMPATLRKLDDKSSDSGDPENDEEEKMGMVDDRTKTIDSKWTVDNEITDRSVLSEELANFCSEYPIYQVKFLDDSETSTTIHTKGTKHRTRRSSEFPPIGVSVLCPGGKSIVTDGDVSWCSDIQGCWRQVYKVHSYSCFQTVRCFSWGCVYLHFTQEVYCLEYQCKEDTSHHIDNTTA